MHFNSYLITSILEMRIFTVLTNLKTYTKTINKEFLRAGATT